MAKNPNTHPLDELNDFEVLDNFRALTNAHISQISKSVHKKVNDILNENKIFIEELKDAKYRMSLEKLFGKRFWSGTTYINKDPYFKTDNITEAIPLLFHYLEADTRSQIASVLKDEMKTVLPSNHTFLRRKFSKQRRPEFGKTTDDEDSEFDVVEDDEDSEFEVVDDDQPINLAEDENLAIDDEPEESPIAASSVQQPQVTALPVSPERFQVPPSPQRPPSRQVPPNPHQSQVPPNSSPSQIPVAPSVQKLPNPQAQTSPQQSPGVPPQPEEQRRGEPPTQQLSGQGNNASRTLGQNAQVAGQPWQEKMKRWGENFVNTFNIFSDQFWVKVALNPKNSNSGDSRDAG